MSDVLTIGNFDGVHIGHRRLLSQARQLAETVNGQVVAMTFDPFPAALLRPNHQALKLMTIDQRIERLKQAGADDIHVVTPTPEFLALEPAPFLDWLTSQHDVAAIVEGENFRFGSSRHGDGALLKRLCGDRRIVCHIEPFAEVVLSDLLTAPVSSTLVRWLISHGRVSDAARCLTQPFSLSSLVVQGEQRGRTIGVPTANLDPSEMVGMAIPADGVYAGLAFIPETDRPYPAAISIGIKPTFARHQRTIEAHLLGYDGDLYGQTIRLELTRYLREQRPFPSPSELIAQVHRDLDRVRCLVDQEMLLLPSLPEPCP